MDDIKFTMAELLALGLTRDLFNRMVQLPVMHPSDNREVEYHIHAIQNIILARCGQRMIEIQKTAK